MGAQRAIQDLYVKFALQNVEGVAEIASFGGYQQQYEVTVDPNKLTYYKISFSEVMDAIRNNNNETGGRKFEMSDIGYMIRTSGGSIWDMEDIGKLQLQDETADSVWTRAIAMVQMYRASRLAIFDLNGKGAAVRGLG